MTVSIRFTGIDDTFRQLREELGEAAAQAVDQRTLQLLDNLREVTPVDTGNARNSYYITADAQPGLFSNEVQTSIINTAPYIEELNAGSSQQAPARFIEQEALKLFDPDGVIVNRIATRRQL